MKQTQIKPEILDILKSATLTGTNLVLNSGQLDRKTYTEVDKVLKELGGKWNTKAKAHIFDIDAKDVLDTVLDKGEVAFAKDNGYFPTPHSLAEELAEWAELTASCHVLEPSAGTGNLVRAVIDEEPTAIVTCFEINSKFTTELKDKFSKDQVFVNEQDFLSTYGVPEYDRVVMNPPFDKQRSEVHHTLHAFLCLKKGGILVAILPTGVWDRSDKLSKSFQKWLDDNGALVVNNDDGSFKESGTMVNTLRIKVIK